MENKETECMYPNCTKSTCICNLPTPVDELDLEESMQTWFDGMDGAGYDKYDVFKAGYQAHAQAQQSKVVEAIKERIVYYEMTKANTTQQGRLSCSLIIDELTDLLTKFKTLNNGKDR